MKEVRIGLVGLGNIGARHAAALAEGRVPRARLSAVADGNESRRARFPRVPGFADVATLASSGTVDAVVVATPHFSHVPHGLAALGAGLHVMIEKPLAPHVAAAQQLLAAPRRPGQVLAAMHNQRSDPVFLNIRRMLGDGALGTVQRASWTVTNWFRPDAYYASSAWRASWAGEGGGVLLNQALHNLDLVAWLFGPPRRVRAHCAFGRHHPIEVEDEVSAWVQWDNGATLTFVTSTGEAPGTNRLEIAGDLGRLVRENGVSTITRNAVSAAAFSRATAEAFGQPATTTEVLPDPDPVDQHGLLLANFAAAILSGAPLVAPAEDAIHAVALANAMLLSAWQERTVELPFDAAVYEQELARRIRTSRPPAIARRADVIADLDRSFSR